MKYIGVLLVLLSANFADAAPIEKCSAEISQAMAAFSANDGSGDLVRSRVNNSVPYINRVKMPDIDWRYIHGVRFIDFNYDGNFHVVLDVQNINYFRPKFYVVVGEIGKTEMDGLFERYDSKKSKELISAYIDKVPDDPEESAKFIIENEVANMEDLLLYGQQKDLTYRLPINLNGRYYIVALLGEREDHSKIYYIYGLKGRTLNSVCMYEAK